MVIGMRVCGSVRVCGFSVGSLVGGGTNPKKGWGFGRDPNDMGQGGWSLGLAPCRNGTTDLEWAKVLSMVVVDVCSVEDGGGGGGWPAGRSVEWTESSSCVLRVVWVERSERLNTSRSSGVRGGLGLLGLFLYLSRIFLILSSSWDSGGVSVGLCGERGRLCSALILLM